MPMVSTSFTRYVHNIFYCTKWMINMSIYLQLPEHLKNYHKQWSDNRNEENSIEQHKSAYNDIRSLLAAPITIPPITVAPRRTLDQEIDTTRRHPSVQEVTEWHVDMLLGNHMTRQSATQFYYGEQPPQPSKSAGKKGTGHAASTTATGVTAKTRKPRTCVTCKRTDCQGAFRGRPCQYRPTQVCSIVNSYGCSSSNPHYSSHLPFKIC